MLLLYLPFKMDSTCSPSAETAQTLQVKECRDTYSPALGNSAPCNVTRAPRDMSTRLKQPTRPGVRKGSEVDMLPPKYVPAQLHLSRQGISECLTHLQQPPVSSNNSAASKGFERPSSGQDLVGMRVAAARPASSHHRLQTPYSSL